MDRDYSSTPPEEFTTTSTTSVEEADRYWYQLNTDKLDEQEAPIPSIKKHRAKYMLVLTSNLVHDTEDRPNWWFRMWARLLLGWKWIKNVN